MKRSIIIVALLLLVLTSTTLFAQSPINGVVSFHRPQVLRQWERLVGEDVVVEGIAWGLDKGRGYYVVYIGGTVNVSRAEFAQNDVFGRLVRVQGKFVKYGPLRKVPNGAQAPRQLPEDRYAIENPRVELIDRVGEPILRVDPKSAVRASPKVKLFNGELKEFNNDG